MSTSSYSLIQKLLEFQNTFINLVHSQILAFTEAQQKKEALLKFQILRMSDKNECFNEMVSTLRRQLIEQKQQADQVLKSYFTKILDLDYLPFLHINRYELTKLSIFGFDIYIDPLQAILQILNRLERTFYILQESLKENSEEYLKLKQKGSWEILLSGWSNYYIYLNFYKLSLNIYMLKEYIQTADTSLFKKDKQIIFTGVYNFYKKLIPRLIEMNQIDFLQQLADLNNTMYSFHGSFDYFMFYTCLTPQKRFIKVYDRIKDLQRKCKTTNILTPLLFGILNNFKAFNLFVNQVQTPDYIHLLRVLLSGLVINFKLRILEYDQVLELIGATITKLNLLKGMKFQIISGDLGKEWREAKDFFISAFKSGYNVGEIQTWNLSESQKIQPKIRNYLTEGTLLLENCKYDPFIKTLEKEQLQEILSNQISELTSGAQTLSSLTNNWKKITISQNQSAESKWLNIIRIVNLINVLENHSQRLIYAACSAMIQINCSNPLLQSVLAESSETLNSMVTVINRKQSISNLKYILPDFHRKYTPKNTFQDIVPVYFHSFIIKQSLENLINVIESLQTENICIYIKQILISLIQKYCPKPQNTFQTLKNFETSYKIPYQVVHMDSEITSVFTHLTKLISTSEGNNLLVASEMFINLLRYCPWYVVSVLNLPTLINEKIESFLSWLIKSQNQKASLLLNQMLSLIDKFSKQNEPWNLKEYLHECVYFSVLDTILNVLSEKTASQKWHEDSPNVDKIIDLVELYVQIQSQFMSLASKQVSQTHLNEGFEKVSQSLLELVSCILRNGDFSLTKTNKCCQIYWRIIKRIRGKQIDQWYQKMMLNLVFSTFGSESLSSYETFKGITLISSSRNYMTSKESNSQNFDTQKNGSSERYNFSEIKQFYESQYSALESHGNKSLNKEDARQFYELSESSSVGNKSLIKLSFLHLTHHREFLPTLSQSKISQIYSVYVNGSDEDKQLAKFCLSLLKLNSSNHKIIWNLAKNNQQSQFLTDLKFTRETVGQIFEVTEKISKIAPEQKNQNQILLNMLNLQLLSQNVNELQLLSSSYYFDSQKIQPFLKNRSYLWFLIVSNNSNWREFNQVFSTYLKNQNFMSILLQYKEFLTITKKSSKDYQQKIDQFAQIVNQYSFYIQKKIEFIHLLKSTDSQQENDIRKSTLLLNVKIVLLKCQFERILERIVNVGRLLSQNSLENPSLIRLIQSIHFLNSLCNTLAEGNVELPSFSYHNSYLAENSRQNQFLLGQWLENIEKVFGEESGTKYEPRKEIFDVKTSIREFLGDKESESDNVMRRVLAKDCDRENISEELTKLKECLKQYIVEDERNILRLNHESQTQINSTIVDQCYQLGHLLYLQNHKNDSNTEKSLQKLSLLLRSLIQREVLPLQIIKEIDPSSYHHLKLVLINEDQNHSKLTKNQSEEQPSTTQSLEDHKGQQTQKIQERQKSEQNFFVWRQEQLVQNGRTIRVNQNNKRQYVDLVGKVVIGKNNLLLNKAFALGYLIGILFNQN